MIPLAYNRCSQAVVTSVTPVNEWPNWQSAAAGRLVILRRRNESSFRYRLLLTAAVMPPGLKSHVAVCIAMEAKLLRAASEKIQTKQLPRTVKIRTILSLLELNFFALIIREAPLT